MVFRNHLFTEFSTEAQCIDYVSTLHWTKGEGIIVCYETKTDSLAFARKKIKSPSYCREHFTLEAGPQNSKNWRGKFLYEYIVDTWLKEEEFLLYTYHPEMVSNYESFLQALYELFSHADSLIDAKKSKTIAEALHQVDYFKRKSIAQTLVKNFYFKTDLPPLGERSDIYKRFLKNMFRNRFQHRENLVTFLQDFLLTDTLIKQLA